MEFLFKVTKCSKLIVLMVVQLCEYTKNAELYTLNGSIVWYVNYILKKSLLKNSGKEIKTLTAVDLSSWGQ